MNKFIKEQLDNLKVAKCEYSEDSTEIFIPKKTKNMEANLNEIKLFKTYLIEFADYILNEPPGFTLHTNWNNGIKPVDKCMKAYVIQDIGKMVKLKCTGFNVLDNKDLNTNWTGWCPKKSIKIIKEIDVE